MKQPDEKTLQRVYKMSFASVYPHYLHKVEKKGRSKQELDEVILWLTGYSSKQLSKILEGGVDIEAFVTDAPRLNPNRSLISGTVCGVRVEDIEDSIMREIRYLDKLVDELAKGRPMEKILRQVEAISVGSTTKAITEVNG